MHRSKWQRQDVERIYHDYLENNLSQDEIARKYSIAASTMYNLFRREGLKTKLAQKIEKERHFTLDEVRKMHEGYLRTSLSAQKYARQEWGIPTITMFRLFQKFGLPTKREGQNEHDSEECPQMKQHLFCAYCPCQPPCQDWECPHCENKKWCACWHAEKRTPEWNEQYSKWKFKHEIQKRLQRWWRARVADTKIRKDLVEESCSESFLLSSL